MLVWPYEILWQPYPIYGIWNSRFGIFQSKLVSLSLSLSLQNEKHLHLSWRYYSFILQDFSFLVSKRAYSTWYSQAVSHPSPNQAQPCLAFEIRRDRALQSWFGRTKYCDNHSLLMVFETPDLVFFNPRWSLSLFLGKMKSSFIFHEGTTCSYCKISRLSHIEVLTRPNPA